LFKDFHHSENEQNVFYRFLSFDSISDWSPKEKDEHWIRKSASCNQPYLRISPSLLLAEGIDHRALYRFKDFYLLYPQIALYIRTNQHSFSQQIVGLMTPQLEAFQKVESLTPQYQNKMRVPA